MCFSVPGNTLSTVTEWSLPFSTFCVKSKKKQVSPPFFPHSNSSTNRTAGWCVIAEKYHNFPRPTARYSTPNVRRIQFNMGYFDLIRKGLFPIPQRISTSHNTIKHTFLQACVSSCPGVTLFTTRGQLPSNAAYQLWCQKKERAFFLLFFFFGSYCGIIQAELSRARWRLLLWVNCQVEVNASPSIVSLY